jgi:hypothetical protein
MSEGAALADFVWYCACGDGHDLSEDLKRAQDTAMPTITITLGDADYTNCIQERNRRHHFSTHSPDWDRCVPYLYEFEPPKNLTETKYLACFVGSFKTNPGRQCLKALDIHDAAIIETDWWHSEGQHKELRARYNEMLDKSQFALCPRGIGRSSMRLVDAILRSAIPIMIDDQTKLFGQDLGQFALWSGMKTEDIAYALKVAKDMSTSEYGVRLDRMVHFTNDYLLVDYHSGCQGTLGYTEYIRKYVEAKS